jgi:hypothetical protein
VYWSTSFLPLLLKDGVFPEMSYLQGCACQALHMQRDLLPGQADLCTTQAATYDNCPSAKLFPNGFSTDLVFFAR